MSIGSRARLLPAPRPGGSVPGTRALAGGPCSPACARPRRAGRRTHPSLCSGRSRSVCQSALSAPRLPAAGGRGDLRGRPVRRVVSNGLFRPKIRAGCFARRAWRRRRRASRANPTACIHVLCTPVPAAQPAFASLASKLPPCRLSAPGCPPPRVAVPACHPSPTPRCPSPPRCPSLAASASAAPLPGTPWRSCPLLPPTPRPPLPAMTRWRT